MLDDDNANEVGDGGTSDAEGEGYECVISFKDGMKEVELEQLCVDANKIESGVEVDDNDAFVCEVKDNTSNSSLYGAPPGWSGPSAPADWNPNVNRNCGEPQFEDVDNPDGWSNYLSDQCLKQEEENTSVMQCWLVLFLYLLML